MSIGLSGPILAVGALICPLAGGLHRTQAPPYEAPIIGHMSAGRDDLTASCRPTVLRVTSK